MSAIALLSDDLLCDIFVSATGRSIDDKIAVTQVSRRWRFVALGTSLLWASFFLETKKDFSRMPFLLDRSGDSPLDIELSCDSAVCNRDVLQSLTRHAARIRAFTAQLHDAPRDHTLAPLLHEGTHLPSLETLSVEAKSTSLRFAGAPALRVLRLLYVDIDTETLNPMLNPKLTTVELRLGAVLNASALLPVLTRCPNLTRLVFHTRGFPDPALVEAPISPAPTLRTLDLGMAISEMVHVLDGLIGTPGAVLDEITARVFGNIMGAHRIFDTILRGTAPLVMLEWLPSRVVLRDAAGRVRTLLHCSHISFAWYWSYFERRHALCSSLTTLVFGINVWDEVAIAQPEHPLRSQHGIHLRITVGIEEKRRLRFQGMHINLRELHVPGLHSAVFTCQDYTALSVDVILLALTRLHSGHGRPVEVAVEGRVSKQDAAFAAQFQQYVRTRVALETPGRWGVSFV